MARLAPIVVTAAEEGDEVAQEILHAACSALAHMELTVLRRLSAINKPFRVYYSGGKLIEEGAGCGYINEKARAATFALQKRRSDG